MTNLTEQQRAAIERLESKREDVPHAERVKRMKAAMSVTRQEVESSLAATEMTRKNKSKHSA
jgi:hypothetical protein